MSAGSLGMAQPLISVVMSVYNGAPHLRRAVASILGQQGADFEFIIINDGSTDGSGRILAEYAASDPRIRVIEQENTGLTKALIRGCQEAQGEFIARQDSDDISMPGRLLKQVEVMHHDSSVVMVSSWAQVFGPDGEALLVIKRPEDPVEGTRQLLYERVGPAGHGSVMFRRAAYEAVGGYRPEFYYAQDSDLWLRMALVGKMAYVREVLYCYGLCDESISGALHHAKVPFAKLVEDCHAARLAGRSDAELLRNAPRPQNVASPQRAAARARQFYFIARCLEKREDPRAYRYYRKCVFTYPWYWRGWLRLAAWCIRSGSPPDA